MVEELEDPRRTEPSFTLGEREMLEGWLEFHRITLLIKCEGLDDAGRKARPVPTSKLSLHGLIRHMAEVERDWFQRALLEDPDAGPIWLDPAVDDSELVPLDDADWEADLGRWQVGVRRQPDGGRDPDELDDTGDQAGEAVLVAMDLQPHDRGVRPAQRPRRPHPRDGRRHG